MTDFWLNHFNVYAAEGPTRWTSRRVGARHDPSRTRWAASATCCARPRRAQRCSHYLDNATSVRHPARARRRRRLRAQRNYARELMELTRSASPAAYTQSDVLNCARVHRLDDHAAASGRIAFVFVPWPCTTTRRQAMLGHRIRPDVTRRRRARACSTCWREPATAEHVVRAASRFVADVPPETLVQRRTSGCAPTATSPR